MPERRLPSIDRARSAPLPIVAAAADGPEALTPDVLRLVQRAAALPNGMAVIERAPLECASILLGARPVQIEQARAALAAPLARAAAAAALARAVPDGRGAAGAEPRPLPRTAEALVRAAERTPAALRILASASPECAAVIFSVKPALVLEARALLAARGAAGGEGAP